MTPHQEYLRLAQRGGNCFASLSGQGLDAIRESTHKGWALGSEKLKQQIEALGRAVRC